MYYRGEGAEEKKEEGKKKKEHNDQDMGNLFRRTDRRGISVQEYLASCVDEIEVCSQRKQIQCSQLIGD